MSEVHYKEKVWATFGVLFRDKNGDPWITSLVKQKFNTYQQAIVWITELQLDMLEKKHTEPGYAKGAGPPINERYYKLIREAHMYAGYRYGNKHLERDRPIPIKIDVYKFTNDNKHKLVSHKTFNIQKGEHL